MSGLETGGAGNPELAAEQRNAELQEALKTELDKYSSEYSKDPESLKKMIESDEMYRANKVALSEAIE